MELFMVFSLLLSNDLQFKSKLTIFRRELYIVFARWSVPPNNTIRVVKS
jgi:hypothetical protein